MNGVGGMIPSVVAVVASALLLGTAFPREALTFRAAARENPPASAAFVFLDRETETEVLRSVRDTWLKGASGGHLVANLVSAGLPPMPACEVLPIGTRGRVPPLPIVETAVGPYLPSCRAPDPVRFAPEPVRRQQPFSREELLKIK